MSEWTTLGQVCADGLIQTGPFGSQLHAEDYVRDGVPVVMPANIREGRVDTAGIARIAPNDIERLARHKLAKGDIVYSRRGDITRCALVTERESGWLCGTGCLLVRPGSAADHQWLYYWLSTPETHDWLMRHAVGATMLNLNTTILSELPVELPLLDEQRRIAAALGALDDLIDVNRRAIADLRELAQSTFTVASTDGEVLPFSQIAMQARDGVRGIELTAKTPYLGLEHFATDGGGVAAVGDAGAVDSHKSRFRSGDVLYGKLRPYFRKFDRPGFDGVCSTEIWVLRPRPGWAAAMLDAIVQRPDFTEFAMAGSGGTRMPRANWDHIGTMPVAVPPLSDRPALDAQLEQLWRTRVQLTEEIAELTRARQATLPLLMSGTARVSESLAV